MSRVETKVRARRSRGGGGGGLVLRKAQNQTKGGQCLVLRQRSEPGEGRGVSC